MNSKNLQSEFEDEMANDQEATSLSEGQIYDFITNEPIKASATEAILQTVAKSLVEEYGFEHTQLERDFTAKYEIYDDRGKTKKVRRKINAVVFPEGLKKDDQNEIIRVCIVQSPNTKANN